MYAAIGRVALMTISLITTGRKADMKKMLDVLAVLPKAEEGLQSVAVWVGDFFTRAINFVRREVLGLGELEICISSHPAVLEWCKKVVQIANEAHFGKLPITTVNGDRIFKLYMQGMKYCSDFPRNKDNEAIRNDLDVHIRMLLKMMGPFEAANVTCGGARQEPVAVVLRGATGSGKTTALLPIMIDVGMRKIPEEDRESFRKNYMDHVFTRNPEVEYWEGYNGQFMFVHDELGQLRDMQGDKDNQWMEIIRMVGMFPMMLHMAELKMKSNTLFRSKFCFFTTNDYQFKLVSIYDAEAVRRRLNFCFEVTPKLKYCKPGYGATLKSRRLDTDHPEIRDCPFNKDIYEFHRFDLIDEDFTGEVYGYDDFVDLICDEYDRKAGKNDKYLKYLKDLADSYVAKPQMLSPAQQVTERVKEETFSDAPEMLDIDDILDLVDDVTSQPTMELSKDEIEELDSLLPEGIKSQTIWSILQENNRKLCDKVRGKYADIRKVFVNLPKTIQFESIMQKARSCAFGTATKTLDVAKGCIKRIATWIRVAGEYIGECMEKHPYLTILASLVGWVVATLSGLMLIGPALMKMAAATVVRNPNLPPDDPVYWTPERHAQVEKAIEKLQKYVKYLTHGYEALEDLHGQTTWYPFQFPRHHTNGQTCHGPYCHVCHSCTQVFNGPGPYRPKIKKCELADVDGPIVVTLKNAMANWMSGKMYECPERNFESPFAKPESGTKGRGKKHGKGHKQRVGRRRLEPAAFEIAQTDEDMWSDEVLEKYIKYETVRMEKEKGVPQGGVDHCGREIMKKLCKRNVWSIYIDGVDKPVGHFIALGGNLAVCPYHYVKFFEDLILQSKGETTINPLKKISPIEIKNELRGISHIMGMDVIINARRTQHAKDSDLCYFQLPKAIGMMPSIRSLFVPTEMLNDVHDYDVVLCVPDEDFAWNWIAKAVPINQYPILDDDGEVWELRRAYKYEVRTKNGDCGSPLLLSNPNIAPRIIGIHVAGTKLGGLSAAITREDVDDAYALFHDTMRMPRELEGYPQIAIPPFEGNFIGIAECPLKVNRPFVTKILPSRLYEEWGPSSTAPAVLRPTNGIDPLKLAVEKYGKAKLELDERECRIACHDWFSVLTSAPNYDYTHVPEICSFEEAITGKVGEEFFDAICRNTSPGYPFCCQPTPGYPGKKRFFGKKTIYDLYRKECDLLRILVDNMERDAVDGVRHLNAFVDCLKDENRPLQKVKELKTRMISAANLPHVILFRMYFIDFIRTVMKTRIYNEVCVGLNVYSMEWDELAKRHKDKGIETIAGDFSGFDTRHCATIMWVILDMINGWYNDGPENASIRRTLWYDLVNSIHVSHDTFYIWFGALPSGHPLTTILNCLINCILFRIVYAHMHPNKPFYEAVLEFKVQCYLSVYGDDNMCTPSARVIKWFNQETIEGPMGAIGYAYTSELKDGSHERRGLERVSFLKRGFRWCYRLHRYVAPLDLEVILESPYWTKKGLMEDQISRDKVDIALEELALHEENIFNEWAPKIIRASMEVLQYTPPLVDYVALQDKCCASDRWW
jgi:hypothetical protein